MDPKCGLHSLEHIVEFSPVRGILRDNYAITTAEEFVGVMASYPHIDAFATALCVSKEQVVRLYGAAYAAIPAHLRKECTTPVDPDLYPLTCDPPQYER